MNKTIIFMNRKIFKVTIIALCIILVITASACSSTKPVELGSAAEGIDELPDDYLYGSATSKSGVVFSIEQPNKALVELKYDAKDAKEDSIFSGEDGVQPQAIARTDSGELVFPLVRHELKKSKKGSISLFFSGLEEVIRQIEIVAVNKKGDEKVIIPLTVTSEESDDQSDLDDAADLAKTLAQDESFLEFANDFFAIQSFDPTTNAEFYLDELAQFPNVYPGGMHFRDYLKSVPEEKFRWVVQELYNVPDDAYERFLDNSNGAYHDDEIEFSSRSTVTMIAGRKVLGIENAEKNGDLITVDLYGVVYGGMGANAGRYAPNMNDYQFGMPPESIPEDYLQKSRAVVERKTIDGEQYWSLHSITPGN